MIERERPHKDRVIHKVYTPKEINHIVGDTFQGYKDYHNLTRSELLLIWEFANEILYYVGDY